MSTWEGGNYYYSGQGVLLIGKRTSLGKPQGLIPVGNVSSLKLAIAQTNLQHKESQSGNRVIDLRLTTETNGTVSAVLESINARNMKIALRGDRTDKLAGSVTSEGILGYVGLVSPLKYAKVTISAVKRGATTLTLFTNDQTPYDYKKNEDAGSIQINDGSVVGVAGLTTGGTAATAIAVGNPTSITIAVPADVVVGDHVIFTGFTGADAANINGKKLEILSITGSPGTAITVNLDTTGDTISHTGSLSFFDHQALTVDYTYAGQQIIDALTQGSQEHFLRFEGLNTADSNRPVVVEVFKVQFDAVKELDLISDALQNITLEGSMLYDTLQSTGSKFFRELLQR